MQVIINLTQNALKFTQNGSITIEVRFEISTKMFLISVCDTGIGIRKCDQVKIFKMFGKLHNNNMQNKQGIGLGLSVCQRIVKAFNGDINVTSEWNQGSKFHFSFEIQNFEPVNSNNNRGLIVLPRDLKHQQLQSDIIQ